MSEKTQKERAVAADDDAANVAAHLGAGDAAEKDMVKHYLAHATRDELIQAFASRNLATVVLFDCMIVTAPGVCEPLTMSQTFGPITQVYGLLSMHAQALCEKIDNQIRANYGTVNNDNLKGT